MINNKSRHLKYIVGCWLHVILSSSMFLDKLIIITYFCNDQRTFYKQVTFPNLFMTPCKCPRIIFSILLKSWLTVFTCWWHISQWFTSSWQPLHWSSAKEQQRCFATESRYKFKLCSKLALKVTPRQVQCLWAQDNQVWEPRLPDTPLAAPVPWTKVAKKSGVS